MDILSKGQIQRCFTRLACLINTMITISLADFEEWVGFAAGSGPPDLQVVGQGAGADLAQAVGFGEVFDRDDRFAHVN